MQQAFDQTSIRLRLLKAVQDGRFRMEALDHPSPGFQKNTKVHPMFFKHGYQGVQHRNLLRETDMVQPEAVATRPDPKDFAEVLPPRNTPQQPDDLPITLDTEDFPL